MHPFCFLLLCFLVQCADQRLGRFHLFFNQIDNYRERHFLYLTSKGMEATVYPEGHESKARAGQRAKAQKDKAQKHSLEGESDDEGAGLTKKEVEESG